MTTSDETRKNGLNGHFNTAAGVLAEGLEPHVARELGRATASGVDTGFIARADHFGFWEVQLKELAQNIKKKQDDFRQLLATMALDEVYKQAQDFAEFLNDEAQKWRKHAEEALDDLQKFTDALPKAIDAFKNGDLKRDKDGNFENDHIPMIVILSMDYYGMTPEDLQNMTDEQAMAHVQQVIDDQDKILVEYSENYELAADIADILENAKEGLSREVECIINNDGLDEEQKTKEIHQAIKECLPQSLEEIEVSPTAHSLLVESAKDVLDHVDPVIKVDSGFSIK